MTTRAPMAAAAQRRTATINIAVGLSPVVILTAAFLLAIQRLAPVTVSGVPLTAILVACAVFTPLLAQVVSAPVFAGIDAVGAADDAAKCATVRASLPSIGPWAVGLCAGIGLALGVMLSWPPQAIGELVVNLVAHLVMAQVMVAGFATRRPFMLLSAWFAYGAALLVYPAWAWWLPATAAAAVQLSWLLVVARGVRLENVPSAWRLARSIPGGLAEGIPIWLLGPTLWLINPAAFEAGIYYPALVPALVGYQAFMFFFADPLWASIGWLYRTMADTPAPQAKEEFARLAADARRGVSSILIGAVVITALGVGIAWLLDAPFAAAAMIVASCASSLMFALSYQCVIIGQRLPLIVGSVLLVGFAALTLATHLDAGFYLFGVGLISLVCGAVALRFALVAWRRPEYTLFWSKAMAL